MKSLSLKWKVLLGTALTSVVAVLLTSFIYAQIEIGNAERNIKETYSMLTKVVGGNSQGALAFNDEDTAKEVLQTLSNDPNVLGAVIYDADGQVFVFNVIGDEVAESLPDGYPSTPAAEPMSQFTADTFEAFDEIKVDGDKMGSIYLKVSLESLNETINEFITTSVIVTILFALLATGVAWLIQRSVIRPVNKIVYALRDIAEGEGDLTRRISIDSADEIGELAHWFNMFAEKIHGVISKFYENANEMTNAADALSSVTQSTAEGTKRQQNEIDHLATAINEMNQTLQEVAGNVASAASESESADTAANQGQQVVIKARTAIEDMAKDIEKASEVIGSLENETQSIGSVLDVIRNIADQTNLLALNAAIEAARAGEHGRGFAVVADEVRTLAVKTQSSTEEIHEMIQRLQTGATNAVKVMEEGREQANVSVSYAVNAGKELENITNAVSTITDMTTRVASATEEQTVVTNEINENIYNISNVANDTAEGAEQMSKGTNDLASMAHSMNKLLSQFKIH